MLRRLLVQVSTQHRRCLFTPHSSFAFRQCSSSSSSSPSQIGNSTFVEHLKGSNQSTEATSQPSSTLSVDRSGLYNPPEHSHEPSSDSELVKHLKGIIKFRGGPISVAEYMEEVLTNPKAGFYINRDVFGAEGDFITSPEVSQMFGEMVGVWAMCLWEQMGQPNRVNLIELGPGRGTLMADLLRASMAFSSSLSLAFINIKEEFSIECLHLFSAGFIKVVWTRIILMKRSISTFARTPVSWHATLEQVPTGLPTIIIAHEFFDALPVHQFQITTLVSIAFFIYLAIVKLMECSWHPPFDIKDLGSMVPLESYMGKLSFKLCKESPPLERASRGWCEKMIDVAEDSSAVSGLELKKLLSLIELRFLSKSMELTQTIAKRISSDGGGALIIDYGLNGVVSDSLQAIQKHKFVDILDNPGTADLSAYVDFASVMHSAEEVSEDVSVHGPITQSQFLGSLGINFRVEALLENCTDEQAESLRTGYWRLVGDGEAPFWEGPDEQVPIGMGTRYLAMAIVNKKQGIPVPFQ
ncbi:hypothetical protein HYC85_029750 [Camellia sinensis]|uniref:Protein arginine methyltransferase NDUFAF7 n=1 Tax=Camellia sinensis TaxID=4442 RepID=A0A7J7FYZ2_CAMSI|nr:hypothetical protein HYC85_029750 [Camellia sinensis]